MIIYIYIYIYIIPERPAPAGAGGFCQGGLLQEKWRGERVRERGVHKLREVLSLDPDPSFLDPKIDQDASKCLKIAPRCFQRFPK